MHHLRRLRKLDMELAHALKLSSTLPVAELKLFPVAAKLAAAPSEYEMHLYEITPISDDELLHGLFADPARPSDVTG